jgi:sugar phosphate isomerase/epimerase
VIASPLNRRRFAQLLATAGAAATGPATAFSQAESRADFRFNYMLASSLYGYMYVGEILPEVTATGGTAIDLWPKVHGNQREQVDDLGEETFRRMLDAHNITLGCITQYKLGPFGLRDEMRFANRFGCSTIVTGAPSKQNAGAAAQGGASLKQAIATFVEQMKPHLALAGELGVTLTIENHAHSLIDTPDSLRWLIELSDAQMGVALAPYHLPQDSQLLATLIRDLGQRIKVFYAWQHGQGSSHRQAKELELEQLPGRGPLDFAPLVQALIDIDYRGWTEIFMHPFPRGISMHETVAEIRDTVNVSRAYMDRLIV